MQIERSSSQTEAESPDTSSVRDQLIQSLKASKDYRHAFVEEAIRSGLAAQIKAMREQMPDRPTQKEFGELLGGKSQSWVARLEDPNAALPTLSTLLSVARGCDVDLHVRFGPFSEFVDWVSGIPHWVPGLSPETLAAPDFDHDPGLIERKTAQSEHAGATRTKQIGNAATGATLFDHSAAASDASMLDTIAEADQASSIRLADPVSQPTKLLTILGGAHGRTKFPSAVA